MTIAGLRRTELRALFVVSCISAITTGCDVYPFGEEGPESSIGNGGVTKRAPLASAAATAGNDRARAAADGGGLLRRFQPARTPLRAP